MSNTAEKMTKAPLQAQDYAPDFTLDLDNGESFTLSAMRGKNVVLYFYPKDDTPGCTIEANEFTRLHRDFENNDTYVLGISKDNSKSHQKFREKFCLTIPLASDIEGSVCDAYDCWVEKSMYGKKYMGIQRDTFLIDTKGVIRKIWRKVSAEGHAKEVLEAVKDL